MAEDRLNEEIGVLARREVEARLLKPLIEAFSARFGREETLAVVRGVIEEMARESGKAMREATGSGSLEALKSQWEPWLRGGALEVEELELSEDRWHFNVTRCRYAELYRELGLADMGEMLSCRRDGALIQGFNDEIKLKRTQTILQGARYCDFRYRRKKKQESS